MTRRRFRVDPAFFADLDALLPTVRGDRGEPSAADFLAYDLPRALEQLAVNYEQVTHPGPWPGSRFLVQTGSLVPMFVLGTILDADGVIVVYHLALDLEPPSHPT